MLEGWDYNLNNLFNIAAFLAFNYFWKKLHLWQDSEYASVKLFRFKSWIKLPSQQA